MQGRWGGLIASGIRTMAVHPRLSVRAGHQDMSVVVGHSVRDMRFLAAVRAAGR